MGKLGNKRKTDRRRNDGDDNGDEEEQLALTPSRPSKRQKKLLISANDLLILPTKLCDWLRHKFVRPLLSTPPSPFPAPPSSSSSDLIPFNNSSGASGSGLSKYDVFISFRGADVRNSFLSHLYYHLNDLRKLAVYKDDVDLKRGEQISPSLLLAIQRSDVYVVILSPKYTDSPWCLEELEEILRRMKQHGRRVIPVFYGVDPSEVENQKLPSSIAGTIRSWRSVLSEIANLSGFDSQVIRPETKLIEEIGRAVFQAIRYSCSQMVNCSAYSASRGLVGVERQIEQLQTLLCSEERSNWTIGLWGMGGIGKTTLAKAFFDVFSSQFEASYFFSNFTETIVGGSLQPFCNLQNHLFLKLLGDENGRAGGTVCYDMMLRRLGRMKALIVIDDAGNDVGNIGPLKDLLNGQYCRLFGPGSVIIMTSRNKQLLKSVCDHVHEVKGLDYKEGSRLFLLHAFRQESVQTEYLAMIWRAVDYVGGNPLAILVLGAHLFGRNLEFWDRELDALENNPNSVVQSILRRSYDGLNPGERDIFLCLACFPLTSWQYYYREEIEELMGLEGGRVNLITNLVDKSLIISIAVGKLSMNRLLQDLGRNIVNEERLIEKRSWLWRFQDILYLFRENKGTESTEGIFLAYNYQTGCTKHYLQLQPDTFVKMTRLRFLLIGHHIKTMVLSENGLKYLPNTLRILDWHRFTSKCLPSQFSAENLIKLKLSNSLIEQLWEGDEHNADLRNLKFLHLGESKRLRKLPNLSRAKKLQEIYLYSCESLVELPSSILDLPKLEFLNLEDCSSLTLDNLEDYANCNGGQSTGHHDILPRLRKLILSYTPIQKVPNFITRLHILELRCKGCSKLTEFPVVPSLERLELTGSLIEEVVELEKFTELKHLDLSGNKQLVLISGDFCKLKSLENIQLDGSSKRSSIGSFIALALERLVPKLSLNGCKSLATLPDSIGNLMHLESLDLSSTAMKALPFSIGNLIQLSELILQGCKSLACLPDTIHKLTNLNKLVLFGCDQLTHLPELPSSLQELDAYGCKSLQTLSIGTVEKHDFTRIHWCFGQCWKLDPVVCNNLVDKFAKDSVRAWLYNCPSLLLPAKWGSESGGEEGNKKGPKNGNNNNTVVTAKLRGQPWKLKSLIFCVLLNSPDPLLNNENYMFLVQCMMLNNNDNAGAEVVVSECFWKPFRKYEDQKEERVLNGHFLVWSTDDARVIRKNTDDSSTVEFFFRGMYQKRMFDLKWQLVQIPDLIKNCQVIPVYNDRLFTNEDREEETDDDDGEFPNHLQGLYDQLCGRPPPVNYFTEET